MRFRFILFAIMPVAASSCSGTVVGSAVAPAGSLADAIRTRIAAVPGAEVGVAFRDLATGDSLFIGADVRFHAASTMKVPVMIQLFRDVDGGRLRLDEPVPVENRFASIVDGSSYSLSAGDDSDSLVYTWLGTRKPLGLLLDHMITRSSNLATNLLIALADAKRADSTAHSLGARDIQVRRGVEDGKAFAAGLNNTTTARDLAALLVAIETNAAASRASSDSMRAILKRQEFNDEIPAGLPPGTPVAHKTGSITAHLHDAAIVYPPRRPPYVLVVLTRGMSDERVARLMIADISRLVWDQANRAPITR